MNQSKIDAALAAALERAGPDQSNFPVFIQLHGDGTQGDEPMLARVGAGGAGQSGPVRTAVLSGQQVAELSEQPWVRQLRLSRPLRLLDEPPPAAGPGTGAADHRDQGGAPDGPG